MQISAVRMSLLVLVVGMCGVRAAQPATSPAEKEFFDQVSVSKSSLTIQAGVYHVAGREVRVSQQAVFEISPAEIVTVENEPLKLSKAKPSAWNSGTPLRGLKGGNINAIDALVPGSVVVRKSPDSPPLAEGKDYLVSPEFGMVGLGTASSVTSDDLVYVSYRYGLMRIDSVFVDAHGQCMYVRGLPEISVPLPPESGCNAVRLCNIFRPARTGELTTEHLYPILETPAMARTLTTPGRLSRVLEKIRANKPVTIVCWGDSVTTGGDASCGSMKYVEQFRRILLDSFGNPCLPINVVNISYGGSASRQWLRMPPFTDEWFKNTGAFPADQVTFDRIAALKPDVVTIEFVNDAYLDAAGVEETYSEILNRLKPFGTELVLITPHFTVAKWMGLKSLKGDECRPYVNALREFAAKHKVALADAAGRWAHLCKEGLPYVTLLRNSVNHPDDRGHRLFAEEMAKCFE